MAGETQGSVLVQYCTVYIYIYDYHVAPGTNLALFAGDTSIYVTEKHKLQRALTAVKSWCELWNININ
jgi:hypothetical protein